MTNDTSPIEAYLEELRCPRTGSPLVPDGEGLATPDGKHRYRLRDGRPDLFVPPERLRIDRPWFDPYPELERMSFELPEPAHGMEPPYGMDRHLAGALGTEGGGRYVLEVGCGARQCEPYFRHLGFRYLGTDVEVRDQGPHVFADAHNLPFRDARFDVYYATAVYQHLVSPLTAALEAYRVLRPGGLIAGTSAFVYGFHDHASFHHLSHAGLLVLLRTAGFEEVRIWPDWYWVQSIPQMGYGRFRRLGPGAPWFFATKGFLGAMEWSYVNVSNAVRTVAGKPLIDPQVRRTHTAGSLTFVAKKPS